MVIIQWLTSQSRQLRVLLGDVLANVDDGRVTRKATRLQSHDVFRRPFRVWQHFKARRPGFHHGNPSLQVAGPDFWEKFGDF